MISFADHPLRVASPSTNQQLYAIFRDDQEIAYDYTKFLASLCGKKYSSALDFQKAGKLSKPRKKFRILLIAPGITPTLTIAFIRPLSLIPDLIDYHLIHSTGKDFLEGESAKDANERRCRRVIDTYRPDVIVMCRYANKDGLRLSSLCREKNIKIVYYIDDLLFEPSLEVLDEINT